MDSLTNRVDKHAFRVDDIDTKEFLRRVSVFSEQVSETLDDAKTRIDTLNTFATGATRYSGTIKVTDAVTLTTINIKFVAGVAVSVS